MYFYLHRNSKKWTFYSVKILKCESFLRPPTGFRLQKFMIFFIVVICLLTSLEHNPKISNPQVISKVV